ncbi:MAG: anion transporter, partial [Methanothrix sp.]|nr:anion transporter [Methanothrix sp.]
EFTLRPLDHGARVTCDTRSMRICQCSLFIIASLILVNAVCTVAGSGSFMSLPLIAICGAAPVILFSKDRVAIVRNIDWATLVFFAAMFVLMESVWQTGFFQSFMETGTVTSVPVILGVSIVVSQFISNVPFVALFQPLIAGAGGTTAQVLALAAGSTIAGNLTILGAASNVIIIQNAEKHGETITFFTFAKAGIPLTVLQAAIYGLFLGFA